MVDVTQLPLSQSIYDKVLEILREPMSLEFKESKSIKNPFELSKLPQYSTDDKAEQFVFFDQFCFDLLKLFGIDKLLEFTQEEYEALKQQAEEQILMNHLQLRIVKNVHDVIVSELKD